MWTTEELFLKLLRTALWGRETWTGQERVDWPALMAMAEEQTVDGLLPDAVTLLPEGVVPTAMEKMRMASRQLLVEQQNVLLNREMTGFLRELNERNIPFVLLKGQGAASRYPIPLHRRSGDIDLYIPKGYFPWVNRGLLAYGGVKTEERPIHIAYVCRGVMWELHHAVRYFQRERMSDRFMERVNGVLPEEYRAIELEGVRVTLFPPTLDVVLMLAHMVEHFYSNGLGLRQLCDWVMLLHRERSALDVAQLQMLLKELELGRTYRVMAEIAVKAMGLPADELPIAVENLQEPMSRGAQRVLDQFFRTGNMGRKATYQRYGKVGFYARFLGRCITFWSFCPGEAMTWPLAKVRRLLTGNVVIPEERSAAREQ